MIETGSAQAGRTAGADLVITNAKIWTADRTRPSARAVAVLGDRIVAVGSTGDIEPWLGVATRVIDAGGQLLLPGFNDSHVHFFSGGAQLDRVQLNDATSARELARRIGERARSTPRGEWIQGGDWDETKWSPVQLPTRELIDPLTPDTPVAVNRYDAHMVLVNSVALRLAGITARTADPPGGAIVRGAGGDPTGALKESAVDLVARVIPPVSREQRLRALRRALAHAASLGVTSVQDMGTDPDDLLAYSMLEERGELTARIYAVSPIASLDHLLKIGIRRAFGGPALRIGAVKGFADGSLGSATACFFEPLLDQPDNRGLLSDQMQPISLMRDRMARADAAGLQLCTHAIGDRAVSIVLDLYGELDSAHGRADRRCRIEHAQHLAVGDFDRLSRLGAIASVQPYHAIDDGRWAERRIGRDRATRTFAFRTFLDRGVLLAFGTDWNVAPLDPMLTLHAAVTRATLDGKNPGGWVPGEKLTLQEALEAYTIHPAHAEFQERVKGSITPGKLADMVLLSNDLFTIAPERWRDVKVQKTFVGGQLVWDREAGQG